jgi:pilus assembly protein CpaC
MFPRSPGRSLAPRLALLTVALTISLTDLAEAQQLGRQSIVHKIEAANERLELVVNTSRILTLGAKIPQVQVNNPDVVGVEPLSETQVQLFAKKAGVTQVNLWDEDNKLHTIDLIVFGDSQELQYLLGSQFPNASLKVFPLANNSVVISGYVDELGQVEHITEMARNYYPQVINNISVGGVQQVMLHVKVMEVSRTKARNLGIDWAAVNGDDFLLSGVGGLMAAFAMPGTSGIVQNASGGGTILAAPSATAAFGVVDGNSAFFGVIEALQRKNVARLVSDPTLVTVSGRAASFNSGGEFPILVPQSLGTVSIEYKKYGTQMDFVPIVLGNGLIRLEVRPKITEIDPTLSVVTQGSNVPALKSREVDTGVEMRPGQTLAIAGLIQQRSEVLQRSVPFLGDIPYVGVAFSRKSEQMNEIELLILVTPQLVEPMNCEEVPPCGPGTMTTMPTDWQYYMKNHLEVPKCCPDGSPYPGAGVEGEGMIQSETVAPGMQQPAPAMQPGSGDARRRVPATVPVARRQQSRPNPSNRQGVRVQPGRPAQASAGQRPGLVGPIGYDVVE